ncbi:MAG: right-handed parallel beta-helix repeat-containing protein [Planctomycetota bacterium]
MNSKIWSSLIMLFGVLSPIGVGQVQAIWNVPTPASSIQFAITASSPGDIILVGAGTWNERIDFLGKDVHVIGQGPGVTILDAGDAGPGVRFASGEGPGAILEGFTIQSGRGDSVCQGLVCFWSGGGVLVYGSSVGYTFPFTDPVIRNCEIVGNFATLGSGVFVFGFARATLEDVHVTANSNVDPLGLSTSPPTAGASIHACLNSMLILRRVTVDGNLHAGVSIEDGNSPSLIEDCDISNNSGTGVVLLGPSHVVRRTRITGNSAVSYAGGILLGGAYANLPVLLEDCLIANNSAGVLGGALHSDSFGYLDVRGSTFYGNTAPVGSLIWCAGFGAFAFRNCILRGHGPNPTNFTAPQVGGATYEFCCVEGGAPGPGNFDLDPLFVDASAGDFHLDPGSPCVDAGSNALATGLTTPHLDGLDGDPRPQFGVIDMGVDECTFVGLSSTMAGGVLGPLGAPVDLLTVNGSSGDSARRVDVSPSQSLSFAMASPPGATGGSPFAIFGALGVPSLDAATTLPSGIGTMAFAPCPLVPFWGDVFFTLTNNVTPLPCGQLIGSYPAPWTSPTIPPLGIPVRFTVQGVVTRADGTLGVTNGVVVVVE